MKQLLLEPVDACDGVVTGAGVEGEETFDEAFGNGENLGVVGEKGHTGYNRTLANSIVTVLILLLFTPHSSYQITS